MNWLARVSTLLLFCSLGASVASAASGLLGTVTDPQGRVVAGATVNVLRRADSSRRETKTDDQGQFSFGTVDPGEYQLTAEYVGFALIRRTVSVSSDGIQIVS